MSWPKALPTWFLIVIAESIHGALRQLFVALMLGDMQASSRSRALPSAIEVVNQRRLGSAIALDQLKSRRRTASNDGAKILLGHSAQVANTESQPESNCKPLADGRRLENG